MKNVFLFTVVLLFLFSGFVSAETQIDNCTDLLTAGETYLLNTSISNSAVSKCMNITENNVTLDCQGFTIDGDDTADYGIFISRTSVEVTNITVRNCILNDWDNAAVYLSKANGNNLYNITSTSGTDEGIYLSTSSDNTIQNNTLSSHTDRGIRFLSSSNNTIENNILSSNDEGILIYSGSNNTLQNNTANSNDYGIHLSSTSNNILSANNMSNNTYNFYITGATNEDHNNTIDTTNIVDGSYKIYYNYSISNYTFDSSTAQNAGAIVCGKCNNITYKDINLSHENYHGLYFFNTTNSTIQNITANSNNYCGIYLRSSSDNTIQNNTLNSNNYCGIYLSSSSDNTIENNIIKSNNDRGIYLLSSLNNTVQDNNINSNLYNGIYIQTSSNNTIQDNNINSNYRAIYHLSGSDNELIKNKLNNNLNLSIINTTLIHETNERVYGINQKIEFNLSVFYLNGTQCSNLNHSISIYPSEAFTVTNTSENLTINFTPTKEGLYSAIVNITTLPDNNTEIRKLIFLVGNRSSATVRYYFHGDEPTHAQPKALGGQDSGSMFSFPPEGEEMRTCGSWIQFQPDKITNFLYTIKNISVNWLYKVSPTPHTRIQRYVAYDANGDYEVQVSAATDYVWNQTNFTDLNLTFDYSWSFYWLSIKLQGSSPYVKTNSTHQSYADFTYIYAGPKIEQFIEEEGDIRNVSILSSVYETAAKENSTLQIEGSGNFTIILNVTSSTYSVKYDDVFCADNENCTINTNANGIVNLTIDLDSLHTIEIIKDTSPPTLSFSCSPTSVTKNGEINCTCSATDDLDSNPTITYTADPPTSSTGTFSTSCVAEDDAGNTNTSSITYIVSGNPGPGGKGTRFLWTKSYSIGDEQSQEGYTKQLEVNQRFKIRIEDEYHFVGVVEITDTSATINVSSNTQSATLTIGEEKRFDVTDDNFYDIWVKLNSIEGDKAELTIKYIHEEIIVEEPEPAPQEPPAERKEPILIYDLLVMILVLVVLIGVIYLGSRHWRKKTYLNLPT